jgi:hypothetical protein
MDVISRGAGWVKTFRGFGGVTLYLGRARKRIYLKPAKSPNLLGRERQKIGDVFETGQLCRSRRMGLGARKAAQELRKKPKIRCSMTTRDDLLEFSLQAATPQAKA